MKYLISSTCCLLSVLTVLGQQTLQSVFNTRDTFELTGKIVPYRSPEMKDSIKLTTYNVAGWPKDTSVKLSADGGFCIRLCRPYGGPVVLDYDNLPLVLYATVSERMSVTFNADKLKAGTSDSTDLIITGGSTAITETMWDYQYYYSLKEFPPDPYKDTSITDRQYAEQKIERMKEELSFLDVYLDARKPVSPLFEDWCRNDILYDAAKSIVFRCFAGKINDRITHRELMELLKDFPLDNPKALNNAQYYGFINLLGVGFMMIVNNNKALENTVRQQGNSRLAVCMQQVDLYTKGLIKELMFYNIYAHALSSDKRELPAEEKLLRMVKNPVLKKSMVADRLSAPVVLLGNK